MKHIKIYTDGACRGNPGPGGWGAILRYDQHEKILSGAETLTTNNRMELLAAIEALAALRETCTVEIYTDSQYVQKGITEWLPGWKKRHWKKADNHPVKNADLWQILLAESEKQTIEWAWVKGHSGHAENERVDELANRGVESIL